ncbi:DUF1289 domain-containing protein [Chitiniphilus eburneus]|uniref:DUF1289 domain-containing protein n=1 Tax=Chitiniphilus eburneus TaxID=2571148 RepID=A0A4U0QN87_9NEIS|nr:cysteine-rich CWC family protein [Chitiniphilus eburneus]TJZ77584.1 DUF1289 domain-containing protein [Chitiniphilus eburneus]
MSTSSPSASPVPSPCVALCRLDEDGVCVGCRRTVDEIAAWSGMDDDAKAAVWQRLRALPPVVRKRCTRCGADFSCGSGGRDGGCWCADLPPAMPLPGAGDCLCPACLEAEIARRSAGRRPTAG